MDTAVTDAPQQFFLEDLSVGMSRSFTRTITAEDVEKFAEVSGDFNPIHLDDDYAANATPFGKRIAHGMLTASLLSTMFGTKFPGLGCIYLSQSLRFKAPVMLGDTVTTTVTVAEINEEKARVTFDCACSVGDKVVLDGQAMLLVPKRG
jgi:3-hydroxybutyryl-CoA dehydratase